MMRRSVVAAALIVVACLACSSDGPPTGISAPGLDSIVIDRARVQPGLENAPWPDTVEAHLAMRARSYGSGPASDGFTVMLSADGGALDSTTITLAARDSAFFTWTLGTHVGVEHISATATAARRSASYAVQVQPGLPDTIVLLGAVPNVRVGDTIVLPEAQLLDRFLNIVHLAGIDVEVWGRFADARDSVPPSSAGEYGGVDVKTDSTGRAVIPPLINRSPVGPSIFLVGWTGSVPFIFAEGPDAGAGGWLGLGGQTFPTIVSTPGPPVNVVITPYPYSEAPRGSTVLVNTAVIDIGANPLPGVRINVSVSQGFGTAPSFVVTDSLGAAQVPFTLDPNIGPNMLQFSAPWLPSCSQCYRFWIYGF